MILYIENPQESPKTLLEIVNIYPKAHDTKSMYKVYRPYILKIKYQKKLIKIPFTVVTKRMKYIGIIFTKKVNDLYSENYMKL